MPELIQAVRGMNDILPPAIPFWHHVEKILERILHGYGYEEIRFPLLEKTELFKRTIGESSDIVKKEMYCFVDRNSESLTLRPEGTASCVRACLEHSLLQTGQPQRYWYTGPFFRHERPQKGRYRQFYQYGAEVFGLPGPDVDAELILMTSSMLDKLGLKSFVKLKLNSLGTPDARAAYRKILVQYFTIHKNQLDEDSQHRLHTNPLRILDSKNPDMKALIAKAPRLSDHLDEDSLKHFEQLQNYLAHVGITYELDPHLVRGLDYYTKTVFEWVTDSLGAQGTVCAGGRYDGLVEQLGGKPTPAIGFALGMERVILMLQQTKSAHKLHKSVHAYFVTDGETAFHAALKIADYLRTKVPSLKLLLHCGGGNIKHQFKKSVKVGD